MFWKQRPRPEPVLDPVVAYDRIAPIYEQISNARMAYLDAIDRLVVANIPEGSRSLLDVGAGDGRRAIAFSRAASISDLVLLEPSVAMQRYWPAGAQKWTLRAEEIREQNRQFDVITCLWNVLGHIRTRAERISVLAELGRLLSWNGVMFLDVNHRYNARSYGVARTALRYIHDRLRPRETNGDVSVCWQVDGSACRTTGHVFTKTEVCQMAAAAGLSIETCHVVDYSTGDIRRRSFEGHLFFILRQLRGDVTS